MTSTNIVGVEPEVVGTQDSVAKPPGTSSPTTNAGGTSGVEGGAVGTTNSGSPSAEAAGESSPTTSTPVPSLPSRPLHANPPTSNENEIRATAPTPPPATPTPQPNLPPDVEALKAMFPDFDVETLESVLASVGGNQERAADLLLGMSDPNYQSEEIAGPTQSELDEEFARRLLLEEQQRQAPQPPFDPRWQQQQQPQGYGYGRGPAGPGSPEEGYERAYGEGRQSGRTSGGQGQGGSGRDTMTEVTEQFNKFAETGKKTFSSLMTKVKAKMQEFDQNRNAPNQASQSNQGSWGGGTVGPQSQPQYPTQRPNSQSPPPQQPTQAQAQPQYYDPSPISLSDSRSGVQGYDTSPAPAPAQPQSRLSTDVGRRSGEAQPSSSPSRVDPSKIGLLPKRPVSLGASAPSSAVAAPTAAPAPAAASAPGQSSTQHRRSSDDELDYVENPFEDGRK